jgi:hypothetical protein
MTIAIGTRDICCAALELSKTNWVRAFAVPGDTKATVHKIKAGEVGRLMSILNDGGAKAERELGRPFQIVLCYEVGYDGFWLARLLIARGVRAIVFDPASFLMPRRGRRAKTDRLDAEGITRTLRTWLSGDRGVAREVRRSFFGGVVVITAGFESLPADRRRLILARMRAFDKFNEDNDPHGEHDFGLIEEGDVSCFRRIDLYEGSDVKLYSIAEPLLVSSLPEAGRRFRCVRSWPCASAHRLVSGESASALVPQSLFTYAESPKAQVAKRVVKCLNPGNGVRAVVGHQTFLEGLGDPRRGSRRSRLGRESPKPGGMRRQRTRSVRDF